MGAKRRQTCSTWRTPSGSALWTSPTSGIPATHLPIIWLLLHMQDLHTWTADLQGMNLLASSLAAAGVTRWHQKLHSIPVSALLHICRTHLHCLKLTYMAVLLRGLTATLVQHSQSAISEIKVECQTVCAIAQISGLPGVWGLVSRTQVPPGHRQPCPLTQPQFPEWFTRGLVPNKHYVDLGQR